ncbi:MAG TPA: SAM-dependent methyltransferase [Candidatus Margulisbacteria bacterium]|nr:MAG: SAM-dependent methyltransferase [Candidatus Margulisbacteria bacterium GWD2_39_127]HAR64346.1 SAM-dependent methyltransferase [Candidatus Margulisiibacteriota bacterium]
MAFNYKEVVPWGRNYDEYKRMFALTDSDMSLKILDCGGGPASFNCTCNQLGGDVISVDPIYNLTKKQIEERIEETYDTVISQTRKNQDKFVWNTIGSVEELGKIRMDAMRLFLSSYEENPHTYVPGELPALPFEDNSFDIALCSHFLFLYTDNLSYQFHRDAIAEMLRIAPEVRIFPILDVNAEISSYLGEILKEFSYKKIEIKKVDYEFQVGGNQLLIIKTNAHGVGKSS